MYKELICVLGEQAGSLFREQEVPPKTILVREGERSRQIWFVRSGCLRQWFNDQGRDISFQFFTEGQAVSQAQHVHPGEHRDLLAACDRPR